jgi:hypothetical protein
VFTTSNASNCVDDKAQDGPEKARYHREWAAKSLDGQSGRISIGDIIRAGEGTFNKRDLCVKERTIHHGESQKEKNKLSSAFPRRQDLAKQPACTSVRKSIHIILFRDSHQSSPKDFDKTDRYKKAKKG